MPVNVSVLLLLAMTLSVSVLPFSLSPLGKFGNVHRIAELVFFALAIAILLVSLVSERRRINWGFFSIWSRVAGVALCGGALWVSWRSEYPLQSLQDIGLFSGSILLCLLFVISLKDVSSTLLEKFFLILLLPGFFYSAQLIAFYFEMVAYAGFSLGQSSLPGFSNFRNFNNLQAVLLPIYFYYAISDGVKSKVVTKIAFFVAVVWALALVYTGARSVIVAFFLSVIVVSFLYPELVSQYRRKLVKFLLLVACLYFFLFLLVPYFQGGQIAGHVARLDSSGRAGLWAFSLRKFVSECVWGCGGQSFVVLTSRGFPFHFGSPHNTFLSLFIEYGFWVGCLSLFLFIRLAGRLIATVTNGFELTLFFSISSFGVDSMFSGAIYSPLVGMCLPILLAGLLSRQAGMVDRAAGKEISPTIIENYINTTILSFLFVCFILCLIISWADMAFFYGPISEVRYSYPRFWEVGNFFL